MGRRGKKKCADKRLESKAEERGFYVHTIVLYLGARVRRWVKGKAQIGLKIWGSMPRDRKSYT